MVRGVVAVVLVATGLLLTGCSSSDQPDQAASRMAAGPEGQTIEDLCLQIVADALPEAQANAAAAAAGYITRISSIDGESLMTTMDYRDDRMNFHLNNGIVTRCTVG